MDFNTAKQIYAENCVPGNQTASNDVSHAMDWLIAEVHRLRLENQKLIEEQENG